MCQLLGLALLTPRRELSGPSRPWVDDSHARPREIVDVVGNEIKAMVDGGRRNQPVEIRQGLWEVKPAPAVGNAGGHRQHPGAVMHLSVEQPNLQSRGLAWVAWVKPFDPVPNFCQREHADEKRLVLLTFKPAPHAGVAPGAFPQFGEDVRVEKGGHRSERELA